MRARTYLLAASRVGAVMVMWPTLRPTATSFLPYQCTHAPGVCSGPHPLFIRRAPGAARRGLGAGATAERQKKHCKGRRCAEFLELGYLSNFASKSRFAAP